MSVAWASSVAPSANILKVAVLIILPIVPFLFMRYCAGMDTSDLEFKVEEWDEPQNRVRYILAMCTNVLIGQAAFDEAVKQRPNRPITLRIGARVIKSTQSR